MQTKVRFLLTYTNGCSIIWKSERTFFLEGLLMTMKLIWDKFYVSIIFVLTCIVLGIILMCTVVGGGNDYSEVNVSEGDSLWALADQYAGKSDMAKADFVSWVEKENNLADGHVEAGESVIIPVHKTKLIKSDSTIQLANQ